MASFPNNYTHRKVADAAAKSCEICYKPSTSVLVAPENKDFFFVCPAHLKDKGFCSPIIDENAVAAAAAAKKKKEMDDLVAKVKEEYEEEQKKKKEKEKKKEKGKDKDDEKKDDKGSEKKVDAKKSEDKAPDPTEVEPREFVLQKAFYQQRIDKKRSAEIAKRNRERLQNPNLFPQVPKGLP